MNVFNCENIRKTNSSLLFLYKNKKKLKKSKKFRNKTELQAKLSTVVIFKFIENIKKNKYKYYIALQ